MEKSETARGKAAHSLSADIRAGMPGAWRARCLTEGKPRLPLWWNYAPDAKKRMVPEKAAAMEERRERRERAGRDAAFAAEEPAVCAFCGPGGKGFAAGAACRALA